MLTILKCLMKLLVDKVAWKGHQLLFLSFFFFFSLSFFPFFFFPFPFSKISQIEEIVRLHFACFLLGLESHFSLSLVVSLLTVFVFLLFLFCFCFCVFSFTFPPLSLPFLHLSFSRFNRHVEHRVALAVQVIIRKLSTVPLFKPMTCYCHSIVE